MEHIKKLVLASGSPRRREILETAGYRFSVISPVAEETVEDTPEKTVLENSKLKAQAAKKETDGTIICADTVVALDNIILGKPKTAENAFNMLSSLSGKSHTVYTGYTVCNGETLISGVEKTQVRMRNISDYEIESYIKTGSPLDKAGAYGIQDAGGMFIAEICGDYYTVMGLPICRISEILKDNFGILPFQF